MTCYVFSFLTFCHSGFAQPVSVSPKLSGLLFEDGGHSLIDVWPT